MKVLEPIVRFVGKLSFRNKLRATAVVFGIPLLAATGALLMEINDRVSSLEHERSVLQIQVPALGFLGSLYHSLAIAEAVQEGAVELESQISESRQANVHAMERLRAVATDNGIWVGSSVSNAKWLGRWDELAKQLSAADAQQLAELIVDVRQEFDAVNAQFGILSDSEVASSRVLDVVSGNLAGLVESTGRATQIGTVVLAKKSVRGSRRSDLTLLRGNFDALVQWAIESLQKVSVERPNVAVLLDDAGSRLNTTYSGLQEAITIKMLDTTDFAMAPADYLMLSQKTFSETLATGEQLVKGADTLLMGRLELLQVQRSLVIATIVATLLLVLAGFMAAYISIMRGLTGLSDAVGTMAAGNLDVRVAVTSSDELGAVGEQFNEMAASLAQRTAELREKTNEIHSMLQSLPQGILTLGTDGKVHPEYSAYLETILETTQVAGESALGLIFAGCSLGVDAMSQLEAGLSACIGEDAMNFEFNSHLFPAEIVKPMAGGRVKTLDLSWTPICDDNDVVEKLLICIRDVTELRALQAEAEHQKRELEMIGQILHVSQEKFHEFVDSARRFIAENEQLLQGANTSTPELVGQLFRNMHTIKGNARTYGLLHLTNIVHEAEQAYDALRQGTVTLDRPALLSQLAAVAASVEEYATLNDVKLGRKGPGRRGSSEKYLMINRDQMAGLLGQLDAYDLAACSHDTLAALLGQVKQDLRLLGTEPVSGVLDGVFESMPSLAKELGKAAPKLVVIDHGVHIRNQATDLLRNVFMHLYRNALDHGIEMPDDRLCAGKEASGLIQLETELVGEHLNMCLKDDGKGLALGRIRQKAMEKGLLGENDVRSDEAVANLIFAAGFSTATTVTEVSGRGVGMDAVQDFIKREGGSIQLELIDDAEGADFRAFVTRLTLPAQLAVAASSSSPMHRADGSGVADETRSDHGLASPILAPAYGAA